MSQQRGRVPKPPMMEHYQARINAVDGLNCTDGLPRKGLIVGTCHHTEEGFFNGTTQFFDNPKNGALTDFQIGGLWDGDFDGVIMRFIEEDQAVAPYANGKIGELQPPFDDGQRFIAKFGAGEALNQRLRSIEHSDGKLPNRDRNLNGRQMESSCFLTAYIHSEEAGQSWDEFDWYLHHRESGCAHSFCPGAWIIDNTKAIRARIVAIMKAYQTNTLLDRPLLITYPPGYDGLEIPQPGAHIADESKQESDEVFAEPITYPWLTEPVELAKGIDRKIGETTVKAMHRTWTATKKTPRYRDSSRKQVIGPPIAKGEEFEGEFVYHSNGEWWVLTRFGTRVRMADLSPQLDLNAA